MRKLANDAYAFALLNTGTDGAPTKISVTMQGLTLPNPSGYNVTEVFTGKYQGLFKQQDSFSAMVNPTGVFFGKAVPLK